MRSRLKHIALCALGAAAMAALAACHGSGPGTTQSVEPTTVVSPTQEPVYEEGSIVGKTFPNAKLVTNFGKETTLRQLSSAPYTLVVLYSPSNESYRNAINQLTLDRGIENAIIDKDLAVVLIDMESNADELHLLSPSFPNIWRRTALTQPLDSVPIPFNPTMYLLDSKWRVVIQRPDIESILKMVEKNKQQ